MEQSKHNQGITSVKVHHPSGGKSNFSLGMDNVEDDRWGNTGKVGQPKTQQQPVQQQQAYNQNHTSNNIFGGPPVQQQQQQQHF